MLRNPKEHRKQGRQGSFLPSLGHGTTLEEKKTELVTACSGYAQQNRSAKHKEKLQVTKHGQSVALQITLSPGCLSQICSVIAVLVIVWGQNWVAALPHARRMYEVTDASGISFWDFFFLREVLSFAAT